VTSDRFDHLFISPTDFDRSLKFYRDVMKWEVINEWQSKDGARGAVLSSGGVDVILAERHKNDDHPLKAGCKEAQPTLHLDIHDLDLRFQEMPQGEHVVVTPEATGWGFRWFVVRDPDGNLIAFNERRQKN
jgi:catechol 2,3-dioxygenase-like lactoylglutathione lyase family enzyme